MHPSENNADKVAPEPNSHSPVTLFALLIIVVQILISLATYPFLPDIVPTHWNVAGQVDAYAPKWVNAVLFPAVSLCMYVLVRLLVALGPRLGSQGRRANQDIVNLILVGVLLFMLVLQLTATAIALGLPVDISFVMNLSLSVLLIFIGNYMGKLRRNPDAMDTCERSLVGAHASFRWMVIRCGRTAGGHYELCAPASLLGHHNYSCVDSCYPGRLFVPGLSALCG